MPKRDYEDSTQLVEDLGLIYSDIVPTPELAAPGGIGTNILNYYETARVAARHVAGTAQVLDIDLRTARRDPHFGLLTTAIKKAADKAENEERFR